MAPCRLAAIAPAQRGQGDQRDDESLMALDRLRISLERSPAMIVGRIAIPDLKLVYAICADESLPYQLGRSPQVYIGATKNGVSRIAQSAAYRADDGRTSAASLPRRPSQTTRPS